MKCKNIVYLTVFLIVFTGCVKYDHLLYLKTDVVQKENIIYSDYILSPSDALFVRIVSNDAQINSLFQTISEDRLINANEVSLYLTSYLISADSTITLPVVGTIKAAGMTLVNFERHLQKMIDENVIETNVSVRLVNYKVTVLGGVSRPGVYPIYQPNATIFDVLAKAGDVENSGNRNEITVLRTIKNVTTKYKIDLGNIESMASPVYYLYPNDVVYVKPLKSQSMRDNIPIYSLMLSTITTFLLVLSFLK